MSYFLFGYNGLGNIGDDLMFECLIAKLPQSERIFSYKRNYTIANEIASAGMKLFFRMIFASNFIIVGGNVFSYERKKSYLKVFFYIVIFFFRFLLGKKNIIDSVGLDLKESVCWRYLVLKSINLCYSVSIRDSLSYRYVRRNAKRGLAISFEYDRVFREKEHIKNIIERHDLVPTHDPNSLMWWVSAPAYKKKANKEQLELCYKLVAKYDKVIFFCQGQCDSDRALKIVDQLKIKNHEIYSYSYNRKDEAINILVNSSHIITERYHGAVLAEVFCKNWQPIPFSEKLLRIKPCVYKTDEVFSD